MPTANEVAIDDTLNEYLGGGEDAQEMVTAAYGERDPWRRMPGGLQHVTDTLLAVSSDPGDYPEPGGGGLSHSAILLGRLVAASSLTASDRNDIQDFMSLCRQGQLQHYLAAVKSTGAELGADTSDSPAGQMRPADERAVIAATGMPSMEVTACIFACATFRVPTVRELKAIGHGSDPVSHASFAKQRKIGLKTYIDFKKPEDAYALREALKKAARQLQNDGWHTAAAAMRTMIEDLSEVTIEEGAAGLFVDYFQEYMDLYRARGLIASAPIDESILRRKVLGRRTGGGGATPTPAAAGASSAAIAQADQVSELLREATRSRSQQATMRDQMAKMKAVIDAIDRPNVFRNLGILAGDDHPAYHGDPTPPGDTRPGTSNACYECGSTEHFGYNCEKRVARLAREEEKRAAKKKAAEKGEKDE